jgi:hypothetical protein
LTKLQATQKFLEALYASHFVVIPVTLHLQIQIPFLKPSPQLLSLPVSLHFKQRSSQLHNLFDDIIACSPPPVPQPNCPPHKAIPCSQSNLKLPNHSSPVRISQPSFSSVFQNNTLPSKLHHLEDIAINNCKIADNLPPSTIPQQHSPQTNVKNPSNKAANNLKSSGHLILVDSPCHQASPNLADFPS